jgi:hypothetical protein
VRYHPGVAIVGAAVQMEASGQTAVAQALRAKAPTASAGDGRDAECRRFLNHRGAQKLGGTTLSFADRAVAQKERR